MKSENINSLSVGHATGKDLQAARAKSEDPTLTRTSVVIKYASDDGYSADCGFSSKRATTPVDALLGALEELTRLTALFGFAAQAKAMFDAKQAEMAEFHAKRCR